MVFICMFNSVNTPKFHDFAQGRWSQIASYASKDNIYSCMFYYIQSNIAIC